MTDLLTLGEHDAATHLLLAHGAGAPMTSPFMELVAGLLAAEGLRVTRFEFGYMAKRRKTGKRAPPPKAERLIEEYIAAVDQVRTDMPAGQRLVIGGKSMGGRVASLVAERLHGDGRAAGLVCLGYPFHPPGKPDQLRTAHLTAMRCPALIVQGDRDPFGSRDEVMAMVNDGSVAESISLCWAPDGDHDLGPRGSSGFTRKGNMAGAVAAVAAFCNGLGAGIARCPPPSQDAAASD